MRMLAALTALWLCVCSGCANLEFQHVSPSLSCYRADANLGQYFYGMNFTFAVDDRVGYHSPPALEPTPQPPEPATADLDDADLLDGH